MKYSPFSCNFGGGEKLVLMGSAQFMLSVDCLSQDFLILWKFSSFGCWSLPGQGQAHISKLSQQISIGVFQSDDGENGLPVHASNAGTVTHEVAMNDSIVRVHVRWLIGHIHTMLKCIFIVQIFNT